jgi:LacI family transcriptional regulator
MTRVTPPRRNASSITAVAARAGVSIATVSRIMNGVQKKASARTVAKVRAAVAELDYRPSSAGRVLRHGQSRLVAVLAANLANPAMAAIAASTEAALRKRGLVMVLADTHERADLQDEYLMEMQAQRVRATVLLAAVASPRLAEVTANGEALLFVNRQSPVDEAAAFVAHSARPQPPSVSPASRLASAGRKPAEMRACGSQQRRALTISTSVIKRWLFSCATARLSMASFAQAI